MKTIGWGMIGCGDVTEVKSGPGFQKAEHSTLMAVMRRNGDLARDYAQRHNIPYWYDKALDVIDHPEVDAVYVATPPAAHKQYTLMAAAAGKPVYVEKPMALNYQECQDMIQACEKASVPLFVAYYRRTLPRFLKIKSLIDDHTIGHVRGVSITFCQPTRDNEKNHENLPWRVIPDIAGGGHFVDLASHMLDFLDFILGPITSAQGTAANQAGLYRAEDIVTGTFAFESGVFGTGLWCSTASDQIDRTDIIGSHGRITYSTFDQDPVILTTPGGVTEFSPENPDPIQQPLIQTIVNELNGVGACPSTGRTGARTNWVMDQMLKHDARNEDLQ